MNLLPQQINFALFAPEMNFTQNLGLTLNEHALVSIDGHICSHTPSIFSVSSFCSSSYRLDIFAKRSSESLPETSIDVPILNSV